MANPPRTECYVTVVFAYLLVGALASRHLTAANSQRVPFLALQSMCDGSAVTVSSLTLP